MWRWTSSGPLVDAARADASADLDWPSGAAIGAALQARLVTLPLPQIVEFEVCYTRAVRLAEQWRVCAAAFVIWNYIFDDTFSDFKAGLLGLGHETFQQVVTDPDLLAGHPIVRAIAARRLDPKVLGGEAIRFAAAGAYEQHTDDADAFWSALDELPADAWRDERNPDQRWPGGFGSIEDGKQIPVQLPRLYALFAASRIKR